MKKIVLSVILIVFLFNIFCPVINSTENMIESIEEKKSVDELKNEEIDDIDLKYGVQEEETNDIDLKDEVQNDETDDNDSIQLIKEE